MDINFSIQYWLELVLTRPLLRPPTKGSSSLRGIFWINLGPSTPTRI